MTLSSNSGWSFTTITTFVSAPPSGGRARRTSRGRNASTWLFHPAGQKAARVGQRAMLRPSQARVKLGRSRLLGELGLPTVLAQEGGYDLESLGQLVREVLLGIEEGR